MATIAVLPNKEVEVLEVVHRAQAGDEEALDMILRGNRKKMLAIARRILKNSADAEDAAQEALLNVFRKIKTFRGNSKFSTWLTSVGINTTLMKLRRKTSRKEESIEVFQGYPSRKSDRKGSEHRVRYQSRLILLDPQFKAVEERSELASSSAEIKEALKKMPNYALWDCIASFIFDWDIAEIAEIRKCGITTVKSGTFRAARWLEENCPKLRSTFLDKVPEHQSKRKLLRYFFEHIFGSAKLDLPESIQRSGKGIQVAYVMERLREGKTISD